MENIDCVYYINLEHRTDRKAQFLAEMRKLEVSEEKIVRIDGIYNKECGALGCAMSHKKTLETFLASSHKNCLIFEDDFKLTIDINYAKFLMKCLFQDNVKFDIVMVSGNILKSEKTGHFYLDKVIDGQTVSGLLITREFAPTILDCFSEAISNLKDWFEKYKERKHEFCIDIYWKKYQPISNWYIFRPKWGVQRESYSDNEYKITNYGV